MRRKKLIEQATDLLDECESASSAVILVHSYIIKGDHDSFDNSVYEMSEGYNDSLRDLLLELFTESSLLDLIKYLEMIKKERDD